ncbi:hypothetical protein HY003_00920 [Candidatus Saccharibacteria bacterium]|nr:hypothetical protein [Candidatus Saccharibacteria bacterium]MBI3337845.1 hypothetical protein [Candidatus Saccharibacteria bacterium]
MPPNQYDFITNPQKLPKKGLLPGIGNSKKQRILMVGVGGILLVIILITVFSFIFGGSGGNTDDLVKAAKQQSELIRISDIALTKARGSDALNLAITTKMTLMAEQQPFLKMIKNQGYSLNAKELAASKNAETDKILTAADQNNQFDVVFLKTLQSGIANYQKTLKKALNTTSNKKARQSISEAYSQAKILFPPATDQL